MTFSENQQYLIYDFESRSEVDLKRAGAHEYAKHASTSVLCVAWRLGTKAKLATAPTHVWSPHREGSAPLAGLLNALASSNVIAVAHNFNFELAVTRHTLGRRHCHTQQHWLEKFPIERGLCTAALAAALALPRSLEGAGAALGLKTQKDMAGRRLLLKMCKPRRPSKKHPLGGWHETPEEVERLMAYCATDVSSETELFLRLPPLSLLERRVWALNEKIVQRGFAVDRQLITACMAMIDEEMKVLKAETLDLTGGITTSQVGALLAWLEDNGTYLPDLTAKTVSDALASGLAEGPVRRVLEIRQAVSKTSTKKFTAFEQRSRNADHRVRDTMIYHSAATGRFGGSGPQPHNLPRPKIHDTLQACEVAREGDLEMVRLLYGDPMALMSDCLRGVIVAPPGRVLYCSDFASIEVRVLFWMAGHERGLQAFRENRDLYCELATDVYARSITKESPKERQLGKVGVLGCGYGLGHKKFHSSCAQQGIEISEELAERTVKAYRRVHYPVPRMWANLERAAVTAVENPGKKYTINKTAWWYQPKPFPCLWCQLPSGRRLAYYGAQVKYEYPRWGGDDKKPVLYYWCINTKTHQWNFEGNYGGSLCENVVSGTARDLMVEAMIREENAGYDVTLSVHDEILAERDEGTGSLAEFQAIMEILPTWASGLPVKTGGFVSRRYKK